MTGAIVVAGDVHLGAATADVEAFNSFLETTERRLDGVGHLVLLGDVWDLVRRDPFGCAWETSETITAIRRVAAERPVHLVFGNHDTHLRHLDAALYEVSFRQELVLESGGVHVRFCHGEAFDRLQSAALSSRLSGPGDRGEIDPTHGLKAPVVERGRRLLQAQKRRLRRIGSVVRSADAADDDVYPRRERRAHAYLESIPEDKLVFGHTHRPYVRGDNAVANPGSWTTTAPDANTFLVIDDGEIELVRYAESDPDWTAIATPTVPVPADD